MLRLATNLGEMPVISGGPFIDMTAPKVGSNFGCTIGVSRTTDGASSTTEGGRGTTDGARGDSVVRSVLLFVFPESESRLSEVAVSSCLDLRRSSSKLFE